MKLKINKACDLSSISVLPPPARRSNGSESSVFGKSQGSQLRSQASQQSFSQGISSQHVMFSQLSQNSLEDILTNEQRVGSEEKEKSLKKMPSLPMVGYPREESQMLLSRPSTNPLTKWNSTTSADNRSQKNEELEHRIWSMENTLNRFAVILDSVQTDIMQANKGTKEVLMEMEGIRQKLTANDNLLQQMNKGQDDIRSNIGGGFKSIHDQLSQDLFQEKLKEIFSAISALKKQMDGHLQNLKPELCKAVTQEMQAIACSLKMPQQKPSPCLVFSPKEISRRATPKEMPSLKKQYSVNGPAIRKNQNCMTTRQYSVNGSAFRENQSRMTTRSQVRPEVCQKANLVPKVEVGSWTSVKTEQAPLTYSRRNNVLKQKRPSPIELDREWRIPIESDEEINGGFSCLFEEKETGNYLTADVKDETDKILRRARRRKRRTRNIIILN